MEAREMTKHCNIIWSCIVFVISAFVSIWLALTSHMFQITMEILLPSLCVSDFETFTYFKLKVKNKEEQ